MDLTQEEIKQKVDALVNDLESKGVSYNSKSENVVGLGDIIEGALSQIGITEESFKALFGLKECNCSKRRKWLNNLLSWKKDGSL